MHPIDATIFARLKAGDEHAYRLIDERFRRTIHAYCYRMILDEQAASDLTQNVFLKVVSGIHSLGHPEAFTTWIFTIARNEVYAFLRSRRNTRPVAEDDVWESGTPLERLLASERTATVQKLLNDLRHEYREAIVLREYDGLSYAEIAKVTGSSEPAVRARLFKARKALLEKLKLHFGRD